VDHISRETPATSDKPPARQRGGDGGYAAAKKEKKMRVAIVVLALAFLALGPLAGSAAAAPPLRENFATAVAGTFKTDCPAGADRCTDTSVLLFVDSGSARACLDIYTYNPSVGLLSYETGCAPVPEGSFTYDTKSLSGAAFSATTIQLQELVCDAGFCQPSGRPDRSAVVAATFTGIGEVSTFRANSKSTFGNCTMYFVGKGSSREAVATVTIDGQPLDPPGFLSVSSQKSKVICR
jgi:hypothetical protein